MKKSWLFLKSKGKNLERFVDIHLNLISGFQYLILETLVVRMLFWHIWGPQGWRSWECFFYIFQGPKVDDCICFLLNMYSTKLIFCSLNACQKYTLTKMYVQITYCIDVCVYYRRLYVTWLDYIFLKTALLLKMHSGC